MSTRLASLLTGIERAIQAEPPSAQQGAWSTIRTINYKLGLARLTVDVRPESDPVRPRGVILVQAFDLADGSHCVKASLTWSESGPESGPVRAVYPRPGTDWENEARMIASAWLAGPPASKVEAISAEVPERLAAAV